MAGYCGRTWIKVARAKLSRRKSGVRFALYCLEPPSNRAYYLTYLLDLPTRCPLYVSDAADLGMAGVLTLAHEVLLDEHRKTYNSYC